MNWKQIIRSASLSFIFYLAVLSSFAQQPEFTRADTLRGTVTPQRAWWDVTYYDLHVKINTSDSTITGSNTIRYRVTGPKRRMQIDLQQPLRIDSVIQDGRSLDFTRDENAWFVTIPDEQPQGARNSITVYYHGKPRVAKNPPWDGGFVWARDDRGRPWIATANQGLGASAWWPNKDHQSEEPDSMEISITVPRPMVNVSNGRLRDRTENGDGTVTWTWFVSNPINNYSVAVNAGNYVSFSDTLQGENGVLDLNYRVLKQHRERAEKQFVQVKPVLRCFEHWFGPYPFYEDSYKLVETPYLGMEHQSAVAYGNNYENGYRGTDLSGTGWGLLWDFIIVHETGHEWFGNNITTKDIADMWVHEGFTHYSESIYTECIYGKQAGAEYVRGVRSNILNQEPIIGRYGVNHQAEDSDMYYKGGNLLHTIRQIIDDDEQWRSILRGLNERFYHSTVTSRQVEKYIAETSGKDLKSVFDQYLRHTDIPTLHYYLDEEKLYYRWMADVDRFDMPVKVTLDEDTYTFIYPAASTWNAIKHRLEDLSRFRIDDDFYIDTERLDNKPAGSR